MPAAFGPQLAQTVHQGFVSSPAAFVTRPATFAPFAFSSVGGRLGPRCSCGRDVSKNELAIGDATHTKRSRHHPFGMWMSADSVLLAANSVLNQKFTPLVDDRREVCAGNQKLSRDIDFRPNGTGQVLIRRGKTDAEGQGRVGYLSRETVKNARAARI
jgi:hypothetical protein